MELFREISMLYRERFIFFRILFIWWEKFEEWDIVVVSRWMYRFLENLVRFLEVLEGWGGWILEISYVFYLKLKN